MDRLPASIIDAEILITGDGLQLVGQSFGARLNLICPFG